MTTRRQFAKALLTSALTSTAAPFVWSRSERVIEIGSNGATSAFDIFDLIRKSLRSNTTFRIHAGMYVCSDQIIIPPDVSGVVVTGAQEGTQPIIKKIQDLPLFRLHGNHCTLSNLQLSGQCDAAKACKPNKQRRSTVLINGSYNLLRSLTVTQSISNGIHLDGNASECTQNTIEDCLIESNSRVGLASARSRNTRINNNRLIRSGFEAVTIDLGTEDCQVTNNLFQITANNGGIGAIGFDACSRVLIAGNTFRETAASKAHIQDGNATGESQDITIRNNRFYGINTPVNLVGSKASVAGNRNILITENEAEPSHTKNFVEYDKDDLLIKEFGNTRNLQK